MLGKQNHDIHFKTSETSRNISQELASPPSPQLPVYASLRGNRRGFWKFPTSIISSGIMLHQIFGFSELCTSMKFEEYITNYELIEAQNKSKIAKIQGVAPISPVDEFMMNAPKLVPEKGYKIKTPEGLVAYYFEDEKGDPFLLDNGNNLWVWAGADPDNPVDDWLVSTPSGDVYNYYMDQQGKLQQKLLGNEKDLKVVPATNLGTLVGFINDEIDSLQYRELPPYSIEHNKGPNTGEERLLPAPVLEEGSMEFKRKNGLVSNLLPFLKDRATVEYEEILRAIQKSDESFRMNSDPFLESVEIPEEDVIDTLKNEGFLKNYEVQHLKTQLKHDMEEEIKTTLEGADVKELPSPVDYANAGEALVRQGYNPHRLRYIPGDLAAEN